MQVILCGDLNNLTVIASENSNPLGWNSKPKDLRKNS